MLVFPRIRPQGQLGRPPAATPSSRSLGAPPGSRKYRVQKGDSISSILQRAGLPRSAASMLVSMNGKKSVMRGTGIDFAPGSLVVGEVLFLPPMRSALSGPPNNLGVDSGCYTQYTPGCAPGYDWSYNDGDPQCCPNGNFGTWLKNCDPGTVWSDAAGKCVEQQTADTPCGPGQYADPYTQNCIPIPSCDGGYWDPLTLQCVKTAGTVAPDCGPGLYPEKNQDGLYTGYCIGGCGANSHFDTASQQCYCNDGYTWADATSTNCVPVSNGGGGGVQPGGGGGNGGGGGEQPQPGGGGGGGGGGNTTSGTTSSDGPGIGTVLLGLGVVAAAGYGAYALSKKSKKAQG